MTQSNPYDFDTHGWPETGFFREYLVTGEEMGKNPVSLIVREWPETSVSPIVRQGLKPLSHSESPLKRTEDVHNVN